MVGTERHALLSILTRNLVVFSLRAIRKVILSWLALRRRLMLCGFQTNNSVKYTSDRTTLGGLIRHNGRGARSVVNKTMVGLQERAHLVVARLMSRREIDGARRLSSLLLVYTSSLRVPS